MDPSPDARSERSAAARWLPLAVFAFAALLFADSARNGFALDDLPLVVHNPLIRELSSLPELFYRDYWAPTQESGLYRPLVTTSFAFDHALGGAEPLGYHIVNVGLHAANSALVAGLLLRLTANVPLAAAASFLFAAHAIHTEPVANVAGGRPELLAALFCLLSLWAYVARWNGEGYAVRLRAAASVLAFGIALLAKESSVTLLGVFFLVDWVFGERAADGGLRNPLRVLHDRIGTYAAYGLVVLVYLQLRTAVLDAAVLPPSRMLDNPLVTLPVGWRIVNAVAVGFEYLERLLLPLHLSYDYSWAQIPLVRSVADLQLWALGGLTLLGVGLTIWSARRSPLLFFALAFSAVTFSVVSNVLVPIGTIMGERLVYLPSIGFCLAAALVLRGLCGLFCREPRTAAFVFALSAAALVGLHGLRAFDRARDWRSQETLWLHDLEVSPRSVKVIANAGAALMELGRPAEALERFDQAIGWGVPPAQFFAPHHGAVFALLELGREDEARARHALAKRQGSPLPAFEILLRMQQERHPAGP